MSLVNTETGEITEGGQHPARGGKKKPRGKPDGSRSSVAHAHTERVVMAARVPNT